MTPEEQIIALGTLDGFTDIHGGDTGAYWRGTKDGRCEPLPDYDSLDVMHRMAMGLDRDSLAYDTYCSHLNQIVAIANSRTDARPIQSCDATAAQRREALLKTLSLWKTPQ